MKNKPIFWIFLIALILFALSPNGRGDPAFANDQVNCQGTLDVNPGLSANRYETSSPTEKTEASDVTQHLVDSGQITAVQGAQASGQASTQQGN